MAGGLNASDAASEKRSAQTDRFNSIVAAIQKKFAEALTESQVQHREFVSNVMKLNEKRTEFIEKTFNPMKEELKVMSHCLDQTDQFNSMVADFEKKLDKASTENQVQHKEFVSNVMKLSEEKLEFIKKTFNTLKEELKVMIRCYDQIDQFNSLVADFEKKFDKALTESQVQHKELVSNVMKLSEKKFEFIKITFNTLKEELKVMSHCHDQKINKDTYVCKYQQPKKNSGK